MSSSESSSEESDLSDIFNPSTDEETELDTSESETDTSDEETEIETSESETDTSDEETEIETSESETDTSDEEDEAIGGFYGFEPEYSKKELAGLSAKHKEDESSSSRDCERDNDDLESSRLENLHW
eukprot:TCONS_00053353-protein